MRELVCLGVCLAFLSAPARAAAQASASDPEVLQGVAEVQEGEYDVAILTLHKAASRLAEDPGKTRDLSTAYLYLGIAYLGKGHEAAAKANFRDAVKQFSEISLDPEQYPPKIINLFESARAEARAEEREERQAAAAEAAPASPADAPADALDQEEGGSKTPLILVGVGGAAAAGVALAAGGGGDSDSADAEPEYRTESYSGTLVAPGERARTYRLQVQGSGTLEATVTWTDPDVEFGLGLWDQPNLHSDLSIAASERIADNSAQLRHGVSPGEYHLEVHLRGGPCVSRADEGGEPCSAGFSLTVRLP
jgi:hypothetical protein